MRPYSPVCWPSDLTMPCGAPHHFAGLTGVLVHVYDEVQDGLADCRVQVNADAGELALRLSGEAVSWTADDVRELYPDRVFDEEWRNLQACAEAAV